MQGKTAMEEANDNPRHLSNQSGVYEQYEVQPHVNEYNQYHNPFEDQPSGSENEKSVNIFILLLLLLSKIILFKCPGMCKSKIFWLVILLVVIITGVVSGLIVFFAFEKKVIIHPEFSLGVLYLKIIP